MADLPQAHGSRRNRTGCFVLLGVLALFLLLYLFAALTAEPGNDSAADIPAAPSGRSSP